MQTIWKCSGVGCNEEARTGWLAPEPRLVCRDHSDQLADGALGIPTDDGHLIIRPLAQHAATGSKP